MEAVAIIVHNNRLVDIKPESNSQWLCPLQEIIRSVQIRIGGIPTNITMEKTFVSDAEFSTSRTGLGSIFWANSHKTMPFPECFILNELPQLESTPIRDYSIKSFPPIMFSYSSQVFHNEKSFDSCFSYNILANDMIHISGEPFLSASQSFEMFLGRFCAFALELRFELPESINMMHSSFKEFSLACYSDMIYAEVNANNVFDRANISIDFFSNTKMKIKFSSFHKEFTFIDFPINIFREISRDGNRNFNPSINCSNTQDIIFDREASWWIISDASIKDRFGFCISTAFIGSLDCSNNKLGLKFRTINSHIFIDSIIEFKVGRISFPADIDCIINCLRIDRKSLSYNDIIIKFDFDYSSVFHKNMEDEQIFKTIGNEEDNERQFIPQINQWASLP